MLLVDYSIDKADEKEMKYVLIRVGDTIDPNEVKVPKSPDDLVDPTPNTSKGLPNFYKVYNPVVWIIF